MTLTESQKKANAKYREKSIKRIPLDVQKEEYEEIRAAADAAGEKVNRYIKKAIRQRIAQEAPSHPTTTPSLLEQHQKASRTDTPVAVLEKHASPKSEKNPAVLPLTPKNIAKVDLDRLVDDFRYQMDIGAVFGMDGLAQLLDMARKDRFSIEKSEAIPQETPSCPEASPKETDDFARSLVEIAKRNGCFKI